MVYKSIIGAICTCLAVISFSADAALVSRLGGLAYYDTEANLTWLADANYAMTSGYDADGLMTWQAANAWAAQLTVGGVSGWRLADTLQPDPSCSAQNGSISFAFHCAGSEMGYLFNIAGVKAGDSEPFSNVQSSDYWSGTEFAPFTDNAWAFGFDFGLQRPSDKSLNLFAWAVQSGDVSAVPVPAAVWLFGSGLLGLVGVARWKKV